MTVININSILFQKQVLRDGKKSSFSNIPEDSH